MPRAGKNAPFRFVRQGRSRTTIWVLVLVYAAFLAAILHLDAALWIVALLALPTLPALWDIWKNPQSGLELTERSLDWWSGSRRASIALNEVDHFRFDTRFDFSVRVSMMSKEGRRIRLPQESLPPNKVFEAELQQRGQSVQRHHFVLF